MCNGDALILTLIVILIIATLFVPEYNDGDILIHEFKCSQYEGDVCVEYRRVKE